MGARAREGTIGARARQREAGSHSLDRPLLVLGGHLRADGEEGVVGDPEAIACPRHMGICCRCHPPRRADCLELHLDDAHSSRRRKDGEIGVEVSGRARGKGVEQLDLYHRLLGLHRLEVDRVLGWVIGRRGGGGIVEDLGHLTDDPWVGLLVLVGLDADDHAQLGLLCPCEPVTVERRPLHPLGTRCRHRLVGDEELRRRAGV